MSSNKFSTSSPSPGGETPVVFLRVQVLSCQDLEAKDRNGYSDPFVTVSILGQRFNTPVCRRNLNPIYAPKDATFHFPIYNSLVHMLGALEFVVWDMIKNDCLGEYKLPVDKWVTGAAFAFDDRDNQDFSVDLVSSRQTTTVCGTMRIKVGFVHPPNSTSLPDFGKIYNALMNTVLASPGAEKGHVGVVLLEICGAKDLPEWPNSWDMDPFVRVSFGDKVICTRVVRHSRDPVWNEPLTLYVSEHNFSLPIRLAIFDRDKFSSNDYVGEVEIYIARLVAVTPKRDLNNEFRPVGFPIEHEFKNLSLTKLNPKRKYTRIPTITFRAIYQSNVALWKPVGQGV